MRQFKFLFFILSLSLLPHLHFGQQNLNAQWFSWYQLKYSLKLRKPWSITFDLQHRRHDLVNFSSQQIIRPGLTLSLKNDIKITGGLAIFYHNIGRSEPFYRPEIRPYTFLDWKQPLGKIEITHRSRFEFRYNRNTQGIELLDGYNFNYRAGHKLGVSIPIQLGSNDLWKIEVYDEVLVNFGKRIQVNHLDQNRIYFGFRSTISQNLSGKIGYMYVFLPTSNTERIATQHILVLGLSFR